MAGIVKNLLKISVVALAIPMVAFGAQKENPRGAASNRNNSIGLQESESSTMLKRSATSVIARTVATNNRQNRTIVTARPAVSQGVKARSVRSVSSNNVNKSRVAAKPSFVRSAVSQDKTTAKAPSRAGVARATAVFNDVTKIGGGYADCRDAYATCMDQICAAANDTYRRCFCSDRFTDFRETSERLDSALTMLAEFQDENLNAVDKTAAEVNAMYTATAGEKAIKKDTSASQKLLNNISSVLSGKYSVKKTNDLNSLGILDFSGFDNDDVWGESSSIFGSDSSNLSDLEGKALYNKANKQCSEIIRESCGSDAVFNLARSSYSIMISQDCNVYEKNINAKRASIEETVRTAEKYLRDARLEEYRAHNSADVNECLTKVEAAMTSPVACGDNFAGCLDYTGRYINSVTGEPIYSKQLFGLNSLIVLDGSADVLKANSDFDKWLDKNKKQFAASALDTCRDLSDTVWQEFKRSALIRIAQAQDEKIQQVKDSCVTTVKECYDTQTGALKDMDTTQAQSTGAIAAVAARGICYEKVLACAALYGDPDGCAYDDSSKKLKDVSGKKCGLQSLLTYVDTVDTVKVAEGCETALRKYAHELCDPRLGEDEDVVYPAGCANVPRSQLRAAMDVRMKTFCAQDLVDSDDSNYLQQSASAFNTNLVNQIVNEIYDELDIVFTSGCENEGGVWVSGSETLPSSSLSLLNQNFYRTYYGTTITSQSQLSELNLPEVGLCVLSDEQQQCEALHGTWNSGSDSQDRGCEFENSQYTSWCRWLGGNWSASDSEGGTCTITNVTWTIP